LYASGNNTESVGSKVMPLTNSSYTLSAFIWIPPNTIETEYAGIIKFGDWDSSPELRVIHSNGQNYLFASWYDSQPNYFSVSSPNPIPMEEWNLLTAVFVPSPQSDPTSIAIYDYINGTLVSSNSVSISGYHLEEGLGNPELAYYGGPQPPLFFVGKLTDVRFYSTALSAPAVAALYRSSVPDFEH
jgi:hypothetical protein